MVAADRLAGDLGEVVGGKRKIADLVLSKSSSLADLDPEQLRSALGLRPDQLLAEDDI